MGRLPHDILDKCGSTDAQSKTKRRIQMSRFYLLLAVLLSMASCQMTTAQTRIDWKQIKNTPNSFSGYGITDFSFSSDNASIKVGNLEVKDGLETKTLTLTPLSSDPSMLRVGSLYYNDVEHKIYVNENGTWKPLWNSISISPDSLGPGVVSITGPLSVSEGITAGGHILTRGSLFADGNINAKRIYLESGYDAEIDAGNGKIYVAETIFNPLESSPTAIRGAVYYNSNDNKLYVYDGSKWSAVGDDIVIDTSMSDTSAHAVQNKVIKTYVDTQDATTLASAKSYADTHDTATLASAKSYTDTKTSGLSVTVDSLMSSTSANPVQNKVIRDYIDTHDSQTLSAAKGYTDGVISGLSTGSIFDEDNSEMHAGAYFTFELGNYNDKKVVAEIGRCNLDTYKSFHNTFYGVLYVGVFDVNSALGGYASEISLTGFKPAATWYESINSNNASAKYIVIGLK